MDNKTDYLSGSKAVVILSSSSDRKTIKIFLKDLGFNVNKIINVDPTDDWESVIEKEKPNMICFSNADDKKPYQKYIEQFEANYPDQFKAIKILINDRAVDCTSELSKWNIDLAITKPYTSESVKGQIDQIIESKIDVSEDKKLISNWNTLIRNNKISELENEINKNASYQDYSFYHFYKAKFFELSDNLTEALDAAGVALDKDSDRIDLINYFIELSAKSKQFHRAKSYIAHILDKKLLTIDLIENIIKCSIGNKQFEDIFMIFSLTKKLDLEKEDKMMIAAGGVIACKFFILKNEKIDQIKKMLKDLLPYSFGKENIKSNILNMLLDIGEQDFVKEQLEKIPQDEFGIEYQIIELRVSAIFDESPYVTLEKGSNLLNQEVKVFDIYEIMIRKSLEAKRDNKYIENLAFQANTHFPQFKDAIEKLYKPS